MERVLPKRRRLLYGYEPVGSVCSLNYLQYHNVFPFGHLHINCLVVFRYSLLDAIRATIPQGSERARNVKTKADSPGS